MNIYTSVHKINGIYKWISPEIEKITGYKPEELIGKNPYDYFHPDDIRATSRSHIGATINPQSVTWRFLCKDRNYKYLRTFSGIINEELYCITHELSNIQILLYKILNV